LWLASGDELAFDCPLELAGNNDSGVAGKSNGRLASRARASVTNARVDDECRETTEQYS
jgi:hypothetical protein